MTTSTALKLDNVTNITSAMVNKLVTLRAEKAAIDKEVKELESFFKKSDENLFESLSHTVKTTLVTANRTDYKAIALKQGISDYMLKKYTKQSTSNRLTVSVKKK
jgi:hypothetical protein